MEILLSRDTYEKIKTEFQLTDNSITDLRSFGDTHVQRLDRRSFDAANDSPFV